ncbi:MAG: M3 family oligoendopeptidase [Candidatus Dojkabacteria bacterium]|nr:M3 family oligoendopeptidase [Candidatus Dojkabacteria bacterium]
MSNRKINLVWDLESLCKDKNDVLQQLSVVTDKVNNFVEKWKSRSDYLVDSKALYEALSDYESLFRYYGSGGNSEYYVSLKSQIYQDDPSTKALYATVYDQVIRNQNNLMFFEVNISKIPLDQQKIFLSNPHLLPYKHYLENIFKFSNHILSVDEEKIINLFSTNAKSKWEKMVQELLSKEVRLLDTRKGRKKVSFEVILAQTRDIDSEYRRKASIALNNIFKKYLDVAEHELNAILEYKKIIDSIRNYSRPDQNRHLQDDISSATVDALVNAVSNKYYLSKKYYEIKSKLLGKNKIYYYERAVPVLFQNVTRRTTSQTYSYEDSFNFILKVLENIDSEFAYILENLNENSLIDVLPKKGKRSGACCFHNLLTQPTYILLNFNNTLNDVLTFAHELGHAINNELIKKKQNALNFATPISTAEVASTFIEDLILEELIKNANSEERLELIMTKLDSDIASIFRQIALYQFEQELHDTYRKNGYLSKNEIGKLFKKHMQNYLGDYVVFDNDSENWWIYWSHIRMYFYVYSYASGLLISKSFQHMLKKDKQFISKVKTFLSAGASDSPENIFKGLGINIQDSSFWEMGLSEIEELILYVEKLSQKF